MASFHELMNSDRIAKIGSVMPELGQYVQKGDVVLMGLDNDDLFPYHDQERPMCGVMDVRRDHTGMEMDVKNMATGEVFTIPKNAVNPEHLWQFEPKSFQKVVAREMDAQETVEPSASTSAAAAAAEAEPMSTEELHSKVAFLESVIGQMAADMSERQTFDMNVTRAIDRLSKDLIRVQDNKAIKFAPAFHDEYAAALSDASDSASEASESGSELSFSESEVSESDVSESELSESELSESDMSSASESSAGSEFAAELLRD